MIVILYSGGLDSMLMYEFAKRTYPDTEVKCVWFDIGQENAWKEKAVLPAFVEVVDLTWFNATAEGKDGNTSGNIFIPGRNLLFATLAATKFLPNEIWLGALKGEDHDAATDKNETFRTLFNMHIGYVLSPFEVQPKLRFPFIELGWGKFELTQWGVKQGLSEKIVNSSSCLSGEHGNCGKCVVCFRRWGIFSQLGLAEEYNEYPPLVEDNIKITLSMLDPRDHHYDEYRKREVIPAMKAYWDESTDEGLQQYLMFRRES